MKILIASDTHGNIEFLNSVIKRESDSDALLHLGDNWEDVDAIKQSIKGWELYRVPGNYHPGLVNRTLNRIEKFEMSGKVFKLVHDLQQLGNQKSCDFILFGHTHVAFCEEIKGIIYLNPGHLKRETDRGQTAAYGVLTLKEDIMIYENKRFDGKLNYSRSWKNSKS
ncbi:MAG: YfcE family phosphodiesterase [Candidatus Zophobacter franzmannii]|jgi:putative phosphoesterase|nr:YfcE family phosphodiesterase [Candidatus Zophobacter franzmannii]